METDRLMPSYPGRRWLIASLTCAGLALAVAPVVFGPLGVVAGMVAAWKGARWWATAAVSASFVAAVVSAYLAAWLMVYRDTGEVLELRPVVSSCWLI